MNINNTVIKRSTEIDIKPSSTLNQQFEWHYSLLSDECDIPEVIASNIQYVTLCMKKTLKLSNEDYASIIASHLQQSNTFMQNDPSTEFHRLETLKAMSQCLQIKKSIKVKLQSSISQNSKEMSLNYWKWFKYKCSLSSMKTRLLLQSVVSVLEVWNSTIKLIEGQFGNGIAAYFKFLRWLILLNVIFSVISIIFIVLPQAMDKTYTSSSFSAWDLITGGGFLTDTIMYYGFYSNDTVKNIFTNGYSVPLGYIITILCSYAFIFVILSVRLALYYRKYYIEINENVQHLYSNKIFCSWDFAIDSSKAANLQLVSINRELMELLLKAENNLYPRSFTKSLMLVIRSTTNMIFLVVTCGIGISFWALLNKYEIHKLETISIMIVPIIITVIINILSLAISILRKIEENYNNKHVNMCVTIIRTYVLLLTVIGILLIFWLIKKANGCWQTELGEELYRLICTDFIISLVGFYTIEVIGSTLCKIFKRKVYKSKFDVGQNTFNLIYNQMLLWLGCYFSPLLSFVITVKMIFVFHAKKHILLKYSQPSLKPWRATQIQTLLLTLSFLGMIAACIMLGYVVTNVQSSECGPFRGYNYTWDFVLDDIFKLKKNNAFWRIMSEFTTPVAGAIILISMCVGTYWLRAKAQASKEMLQILQDLLALQIRDREFLLREFVDVTSAGHCSVRSEIDETNCSIHARNK